MPGPGAALSTVLEVGPKFLEGMHPVYLPTHPQVSSPQGPAWGETEVPVTMGALPSTHTHTHLICIYSQGGPQQTHADPL